MKEEQKQFLAMLHPGTCHRFSNLRMVANEATGHLWKGIWGGPERHFRKIATSNEDEEFLTFQESVFCVTIFRAVLTCDLETRGSGRGYRRRLHRGRQALNIRRLRRRSAR
jgi:hypothetical protein